MTDLEKKLEKAEGNTLKWKLFDSVDDPKEKETVLIAILKEARHEGDCLKVADKAQSKSMLEQIAYQRAREIRTPSLKRYL